MGYNFLTTCVQHLTVDHLIFFLMCVYNYLPLNPLYEESGLGLYVKKGDDFTQILLSFGYCVGLINLCESLNDNTKFPLLYMFDKLRCKHFSLE